MKKENLEEKIELLTEEEVFEVVGGETKNVVQNFFVGAIELYRNLFD